MGGFVDDVEKEFEELSWVCCFFGSSFHLTIE